jgi:hypothetical protein
LKETVDKEFEEQLKTIYTRVSEKAAMLLHMQVPSSYRNKPEVQDLPMIRKPTYIEAAHEPISPEVRSTSEQKDWRS